MRRGAVVVSNGPLLEFEASGKAPGAVISWSREEKVVTGRASAVFHRPIEKIEIIVNGRVVASKDGDGGSTELSLPFKLSLRESSWIAARASAAHQDGEFEIRAHSNPVYLLKDGKPVHIEADRKAVAERWAKETAYYRNPSLFSRKPASGGICCESWKRP